MKQILKRIAGAALILGLAVNSIGGVALASEPVLDEEEASVNSEPIDDGYEQQGDTINESMDNSAEQADINILNEDSFVISDGEILSTESKRHITLFFQIAV